MTNNENLVNGTVNVTNGQAILQVVETLEPGTYVINGAYAENNNYQSGQDTGTLIIIEKKTPSLYLTLQSTAPYYTGYSLTFGVRVEAYESTPTPTGAVTLYEDNIPVAFNQTLSQNGRNGICTIEYTPTTIGLHTYTIQYNGDNNYNPTNLAQGTEVTITVEAEPTSSNVFPNDIYEVQPVFAEVLSNTENNITTTTLATMNRFSSDSINPSNYYTEFEGTFQQLSDTQQFLSSSNLKGIVIVNVTQDYFIQLGQVNAPTVVLDQLLACGFTYGSGVIELNYDTQNTGLMEFNFENLNIQGVPVIFNINPENSALLDEIIIEVQWGDNWTDRTIIYNSVESPIFYDMAMGEIAYDSNSTSFQIALEIAGIPLIQEGTLNQESSEWGIFEKMSGWIYLSNGQHVYLLMLDYRQFNNVNYESTLNQIVASAQEEEYSYITDIVSLDSLDYLITNEYLLMDWNISSAEITPNEEDEWTYWIVLEDAKDNVVEAAN